jgi:hypothetical protein
MSSCFFAVCWCACFSVLICRFVLYTFQEAPSRFVLFIEAIEGILPLFIVAIEEIWPVSVHGGAPDEASKYSNEAWLP